MHAENVVSFPANDDFAALRAYRRRLLERDAAFGASAKGADAILLERTLDALERVELAIMALRAESEEHTREKLQIIRRALECGADAEHIAHLFELARADLERHPFVAA